MTGRDPDDGKGVGASKNAPTPFFYSVISARVRSPGKIQAVTGGAAVVFVERGYADQFGDVARPKGHFERLAGWNVKGGRQSSGVFFALFFQVAGRLRRAVIAPGADPEEPADGARKRRSGNGRNAGR